MQWVLTPLIVLFVISGLFLILIVLVQASRGTGLAGMFGGGGQSSAFGTQTGSLLGKLTVMCAATLLVSALAYALVSDAGSELPTRKETAPTTGQTEPGDGDNPQ